MKTLNCEIIERSNFFSDIVWLQRFFAMQK